MYYVSFVLFVLCLKLYFEHMAAYRIIEYSKDCYKLEQRYLFFWTTIYCDNVWGKTFKDCKTVLDTIIKHKQQAFKPKIVEVYYPNN